MGLAGELDTAQQAELLSQSWLLAFCSGSRMKSFVCCPQSADTAPASGQTPDPLIALIAPQKGAGSPSNFPEQRTEIPTRQAFKGCQKTGYLG